MGQEQKIGMPSVEKKEAETIGHFLEYKVLKDGDRDRTIEAKCCCPACDEEQQDGHFKCSGRPPKNLLEAEENGLVTRGYDRDQWTWSLTKQGEEKMKSDNQEYLDKANQK